MRAPVPVRERFLNQLARTMGWTAVVLGGTALMGLGAALFGGGTAAATTPATSVTFSASPRHKPTPGTNTGQRPESGAEPTAGGPPAREVAPSAVAEPAPASVWDNIAQCESGGRWNISTGNGYHGGLQFKPSTWRAYGGTKYAATANHATKAQQIEIAEKVRAGQGWGAWPACSRKAGLRGGKTGKAASKPDRALAKSGKKAPDKTAENDTCDSHKGKYRHGKKHDHGEKYSRTDKACSAKKASGRKDDKIVVSRGDTLSALARSHKVDGGWRKLYELNTDKLTSPDKIYPGQELAVPKS